MSSESHSNDSINNENVCSFKIYLIQTQIKTPWYIVLILMLSILATLTLMFFGFFFSPSDILSVIAIGICAMLFVTLLICATIIITKYIGKRGMPKEDCHFDSTKTLLEAYKAIFGK